MPGNKKILIATGIYPPDIGGPATLLAALPQALQDRGLEVKVLTYSDVAATSDEVMRGIFRVRRGGLPSWRHWKYFWLMWRLARWADLVYATDLYSVGNFARLIKKMTGKKYILRLAGDSAWEIAVAKGWTDDYIVDFQNKKYNRQIENLKKKRRRILIEADKVIAVSSFLADAAKRIGVAAEKLAVIYNAVDFWEKLPVYQEPPRPVLVFSGRLVPWKGLAMILKVVAKLKSRWPGLRLEVLGDGPERASLEELAKNLGLESNVNWRGQVSEAATHQVFARSTLFVLNTNYEGLPFSVLNAMQVGVPVLTTPVGGNPEVVEHGVSGWLAPFNNEAAWQAALEQLLGDSSLRAKLAQGGRQTLAKFQWQRMVDQTLAVIESL